MRRFTLKRGESHVKHRRPHLSYRQHKTRSTYENQAIQYRTHDALIMVRSAQVCISSWHAPALTHFPAQLADRPFCLTPFV